MSQPPHSDKTPRATSDDGRAPNAAPTGLTHREQQRRRIVIAGLTAPTLMTLPSRRAWSAACSKSKLKKLSGALSAKKKVDTHCDTIGCKRTFWKNELWPVTSAPGAPDPGDSFEGWFLNNLPTPMFDTLTPPTLLQVLEGADILKEDQNKNKTDYEPFDGDLKNLNKQVVAALCNAFFLNNMNFIVGFHIPGTTGFMDPPGTSPAEIIEMYRVAVNAEINGTKDAVKDLKDMLEDENNALGGCPIT